MLPPSVPDDTRQRFLHQFARCCYGQRNAHLILPPLVPRDCEILRDTPESIPEEPSGNGQPRVKCDVDSVERLILLNQMTP